jgi:type II secretory pathway pseudopilin PulG
VIAVIAILAALLLPALAGSKEKARRASCLNNVRQFLIAIHIYSDDGDNRLPSGLSENSNRADEHTPVLARSTYTNLVHCAGSEKVLMCPWLGEPFNKPGGWDYPGYGYIIGYNYLGGHAGTPWPRLGDATAVWTSAQTTAEDPQLPLVTELNAWARSEDKTFAPHGATGAVLRRGSSGNEGSGGIPSAAIGAVGGHVGLLDGSASWKRIAEMQVYRGSRLWDDAGCFTAW